MCSRLLKFSYAPAMLVIGNAAAFALVGARASPAWLLAWLLGVLAASFAAERAIPYIAPPAHARDERARDIAHAVVNEAITVAGLAAIPALDALLPWPGAWPAQWPLGLQWLAAVLVADLGITLMHAASHRVAWLWRFHAVHHSVQRLYGLNGLLKHPVHQVLETLAGVAPLILLGMPQRVGELLACSVALQLVLQHANVDMRIGPLRHVLALAPVHRFHHQRWAGIGDVNFGLFTTLGDRLLGTCADDPGRRFAPGDFGIGQEPDYPRGYLAQLARPFVLRRGAGPA